MDIEKNWKEIVDILRASKRANRHFAIATVDEHGNPHITPIGHVFFRDDMSCYYFDAYSKAMPKNFEHNRHVCLMGVNSGLSFWFKALFKGRFQSAPAVRVYGKVSDPRPATDEELAEYQKSISTTKWLKGHKLLWQGLTRVRDIRFNSFSPATYPAMCEGLWQ